MFQNKMKAVTFSYDDGVTQDQRLIEIFNRYGLKATFNINSALLGRAGSLVRRDVTVAHVKPRPEEIAKIYAGHEVAGHTLTHPSLTDCDDDEIARQVEEDLQALSALVGYPVVGCAYPNGRFDDRVIDVIRTRTSAAYVRNVISSHSFAPQTELLSFCPTLHHAEWDKLFAMAEEFIALKPSTPQIFYVWGHSYEFDIDNSWAKMEEFCKRISNHEDIFYGTNAEVLLAEGR